MLGERYFEMLGRLHEVRSFAGVAAAVVGGLPGLVDAGEAVIVEVDAAGRLQAVFGGGRFAGQLREHVGEQQPLCHGAGGVAVDLGGLGAAGVAGSDHAGPEAYRIDEGVTRIFSSEVPSDCLVGQIVHGEFRSGILCVFREMGSFQDSELRERFDALLLNLRTLLERNACEQVEAMVIQKLLALRSGQPSAVFLVKRTREVIPLSHEAVAFSARRWGRDEPMLSLDPPAVQRLREAASHGWENPTEPRWGSVELNLGRGPERMDVLPKLFGDAVLLMRAEEGHDAGQPASILTERQREIMSWIAEGKTSSEVGIILGISPRTVEKHLEAIFQRMGVENRIAAVRTFLEMQR